MSPCTKNGIEVEAEYALGKDKRLFLITDIKNGLRVVRKRSVPKLNRGNFLIQIDPEISIEDICNDDPATILLRVVPIRRDGDEYLLAAIDLVLFLQYFTLSNQFC